MIKALKSLDRCHIAIILLDASAGIADQDARICGYAFERGRGIILAVNKWDLVKKDQGRKKNLDLSLERHLKFVAFAPRLNISALTGERVNKLFGTIDSLYGQFSSSIGTGVLNRAVDELTRKNPPPRIGRGRLKLFYATQTASRPPTFVMFVNRPDKIHFSYQRYIVNELKAQLGLDLTPIRLNFRKR
jgi:GTP-binding protein